jgi:hypothetical protein
MRIRTVKPEFWKHPVLARLPDAAKLMAIGLLNVADDEGYLLADPILVRNEIRPFDEDSTNTRGALETLEKVGYLAVSEHSEVGPVGFVVNFLKHQRIDRPTPSKLKCYFDSTSIRRGLDEHSLPERKGMEGNGKDQGIGVLELQEEPKPKPQAHTPLMLQVGRWFKRRESTKWSKAELQLLREIGTPDESDLAALEAYYTARHSPEADYRRRDIITLLRNWNGEIDRARRYKPNTGF